MYIRSKKNQVFLGHEISSEGIRQDPNKIRALTQLKKPENAKEVRRILGLLNYYRKFVPNFAMISYPLVRLTRKNVQFNWKDDEENAFQELIRSLKENIVLANFNHEDPLLLKTDASQQGVAGILLQKQSGEWKTGTCCSRRLDKHEENYTITELECLAIVYSLKKIRNYVLGKKIKILTDHNALKVLNTVLRERVCSGLRAAHAPLCCPEWLRDRVYKELRTPE